MRFSCEKRDLSEIINNVLPAVSSKNNIAALEGLLINCYDNKLKITGYNLELGIIKEIDVNSETDGNIILNASLLANIINKMPDGTISFSTDDKLLTLIECNKIEFTILGLNADEFPSVPTINDESEKKISINNQLLKNMISQTIFAVANDATNPALTGSLFNIKDSILKIVSVDGVRLAMRKEKISYDGEDLEFIVPGKSLNEIVKLLNKISIDKSSDDDDDNEEQSKLSNITISVFENHICFSINDYIVISRLLSGKFMDYETAIPSESKTTIVVSTKVLLESINRISIIINERAKSPIKCTFEDDKIKLNCETALGKANEEVDINLTGEDTIVGFNNRYIVDALKASESDKVRMQLNGAIIPIKVLPVDEEDDDFLFLVSPVRLNKN